MENGKITHSQNQKEEFGHELGDINAAKLYEIPFANETHKKSAKQDKECKSRD